MRSAHSIPYPKELFISRPHDVDYRDMLTSLNEAAEANGTWAQKNPFIRYIEYFHYEALLVEIEDLKAELRSKACQ